MAHPHVLRCDASKVSMTQDPYMRWGRVHIEVAALLGRTINDE
jgi:hypothetical protein